MPLKQHSVDGIKIMGKTLKGAIDHILYKPNRQEGCGARARATQN